MAVNTLRELLKQSDGCVLAPCVYDCASARAIELVGFKAMMLSGGELSLAMNGMVDYGFTNLTEIEWMVSRLSQASSLALAVDIENGFGGALQVYRTCKRLVRAGAHALQLEDSSNMEESTELLPREDYYTKIKAAVTPPLFYNRPANNIGTNNGTQIIAQRAKSFFMPARLPLASTTASLNIN